MISTPLITLRPGMATYGMKIYLAEDGSYLLAFAQRLDELARMAHSINKSGPASILERHAADTYITMKLLRTFATEIFRFPLPVQSRTPRTRVH